MFIVRQKADPAAPCDVLRDSICDETCDVNVDSNVYEREM